MKRESDATHTEACFGGLRAMNVRRNHTHDESVDDGDVIHSVPNCCAWAAVRDNRRRMNVWSRRMEWGELRVEN